MAPKISRQRRVQANPVNPEADPELEGTSIMDHFPDAPKPKEEAKSNEPTVADLMKQLADMGQRLDAAERDAARSSAAQPVQPTVVAVGEEPKLDLTNLPDPVTQAPEYAAAIIQRGREYDKRMANYAAQRTAASQPQKYGDPEALFNDFSEAYPEYAVETDRMEWVTSKVAKRLAQRGINVQQYMYTRSDAFFKELTKEYNKTFGNPEDESEEVHVQLEEQRPRRRKAKAQDTDDGDDGRAASILSQTERGPARGQPTEDGRPTGMIAELQDIQRKTGYFG